MNHKTSRRTVLYTALAFLASTLFTLSSATIAWSDYRQLRSELDLFHAFLQKHPKVSAELQKNPQLAYNRKYLDKHDDLRKFFRRHPAVQQEVAERPGHVFGRYYRDDRRYSRYDRWGWGYR